MSYADTVLNKFWDGQLPVDLDHILNRLDIAVKVLEASESDDTSGIACIENGKRVIYVNLNDSVVRRRFTAAHEIGHHVLGHVTPEGRQFRDGKHIFTGDTQSIKETEANKFAADLLMPKLVLEHAILEENIRTIEALAAKFNVSQVAMRIRLENLGFL